MLLFVEDVRLLMAVITWNAEETSFRNKEFTIQKYEARCHTANSVTNYLNENVPDNIRKQNWSPYSCDLNLLDYAIWDIMKKILYKNLKRYENIEGPSAAMSYVWDRLTKKFINNSIDQ